MFPPLLLVRHSYYGAATMADGSGGASGILGVLVGAMIVIFIGGAILYGTGRQPANTASFTIKLPNAH
jgi:hypothetical protein